MSARGQYDEARLGESAITALIISFHHNSPVGVFLFQFNFQNAGLMPSEQDRLIRCLP